MAPPYRFIVFFLVFFILIPHQKIYGSLYRWNDAISDDWGIRGNWVNMDTPTDLGPPASTDTAFIGANDSAEVSTNGLYDTLNLGVGGDPGHVIVTTGEFIGKNTNVGASSILSSNFSTVTVNGGIWNNAENINIGVLSNGKVIINGGQTNASSVNVGVAALGRVTLNGGILSTNSVSGSAQATFVFNGGVLQAISDNSNFISDFSAGKLTSLSDNSTIDAQNFKVGITSAISGTGGLTVTGDNGSVILSEAASYSGVTALTSFGNGITLVQGAPNTLSPRSNVSIGAYCELDLAGKTATIGSLSGVAGSTVTTNGGNAMLTLGNTNSSATFEGGLVNGGTSSILSLTKTGSGVQTFKSSGINLYSGVTNISEGTVTQGATNALSPNSNYSLSVTGKLDMNGFNGVIGSLDGVVGAQVMNSGVGNAVISVGFTSSNGNFSGQLTDGNVVKLGLTKVGLGIQTLSGANTYSGLTTILGGTLLQGATDALSANSNVSIGSFAILDIGGVDGVIGSLTGNLGAQVTNNGLTDAVLSIGATDDSGTYTGILQNGTKQLGLNKVGLGTQILRGANTYSGLTSILGGTLTQGATNALSALSNVFIAGFGTLNLGGFNGSIGSLAGDLGAQVTNNGTSDAVLSIGSTNNSATYAGILQNGTKQLALTKVGLGTQILSGANTYSGLTSILGGILAQGDTNALSPLSNVLIGDPGTLRLNGFDGTIGSLSGATGAIVENNASGNVTLTIGNTDDNGTYAGRLINGALGTLNITKTGAGTQTLTNNRNTYSGFTNIAQGTWTQGIENALSALSHHNLSSAGILKLNGFNGTIGSLSGEAGATVENNASGNVTLTIGNTGNNGTYAGRLINGALGTLNITKTGAGIQTLAGNHNTYSGLTNIAQGTWAQGIENALSPFSNHHIQSSGVLDVNGFNATIGILTGEEGSVATNSGPVVATLTVGSTGESGAFSGILQGQMAINKIGNGAWTLLGPNTYTGGTTVTEGTLIGTTKSLQGTIQNKGNLSFSQSFSGTFRGTISDVGSVNIDSLGRIIFNTPQTYTGNTIIQRGALLVNTTLASENVFINSSGFLGGLATLSGNVVNTGILSPGTNGVGNMTIQNNYTQSPDGTFRIVFNNLQNYGRLFVGRVAELAGQLQVALPNGFPETNTTVPIVTAGEGVNGTFQTVESIPGVKVIYDPLNALLVVPSGSDAIEEAVVTSQDKIEESLSTSSSNGSSTTNNNNSGSIGGDLGPAIIVTGIIGVPVEELLPTMVATMKGIVFNAANTQYAQFVTRLAALRAGVGNFSFQGLSQEPMSEQLSRRDSKWANKQMLATQLEPSRWDIFAFASGIFSKMNSVCDLPRSNAIAGYFTTGANYRFNEYLDIGIYAGYQGIKGWDADGSWMKSNGMKCGVYGTAQWRGFSQWNNISRLQDTLSWEDNFYLNFIVGGGANFFSLNRSIDVKKYHWTARSTPSMGELDSLLGGGYEFNIGLWRFGANTSIQYTYLGTPSFNESGARNLNAKINRQNFSSLVYTLGGNITYLCEIAPNYKIFPTVGLYWQSEFLNYEERIHGRFRSGTGAAFNFASPAGIRNNAFGVAGINAQIGSIGIYSYYTPQFGGNDFTSHGVLIGLNYTF